MVIIEREDGYPGDFGEAFDSEECLQIARELCEKGTIMIDADGKKRGTPPGMGSIIDLSHQMHRAHSRLGQVLEDAGWFRVVELPAYYFPPERKPEGLE